MNPKQRCFLGSTLLGVVLAIVGFAAIVVETPPDALLVQAHAARA